ncbi:galactoside alpha-(1,2)-fucosyltransferase 2-like isoform X2 [Ornithodoros turicata]|uniref:galactoside alpha-(1,2)-fucosyltransferase 2-like isoform X2 n=1 Tax=Ornithodoros turicata TaxID=34597 RepID=UPI00313950AF
MRNDRVIIIDEPSDHQILLKSGGIYLDNDCIVVRPLHQFRHFETSIGWSPEDHMGNMVILFCTVMEIRFPSGHGSSLFVVLVFIFGTIYVYYPMSWKNTVSSCLKNTSQCDDMVDHRFSAGTRFLTMVTNGRLGNQLSGYAFTYAMAKMTNRQGIIYPSMYRELSRYFRITLPVILNETTWNCSGRQSGDWMTEEVYQLSQTCLQFCCYLESWTFFHHAREDIVRELTFHHSYRLQAWRTLSELRGNRTMPTYVGVHVRRGDYVTGMWNIWQATVADSGYLQRAMDYFRGRYTEVVFVVTSDEMSWCEKHINNCCHDVYFMGNRDRNNPGQDLALLAHCNHTIMTVGTFGYWAGYLAGGEVTYLANHSLPDSKLRIIKPEAKHRLPHWIPIPANISCLYTRTNVTVTPTKRKEEREKKGRTVRAGEAQLLSFAEAEYADRFR